MEWIEYKTRNVKGAYLYAPESDKPLPLVVWLTGGNDGAQLPLRFSLGKLLNQGKLKPNCAVLLPAASYGHNYTTMTADELDEMILKAGELADFNYMNISLCGWSLGADAAAILTAESKNQFFADRICLISNYPNAWKGELPPADVQILVGAKEKSASRNWGSYPVERIPGYGHEVGEMIWTDYRYDLLGWLTGETDKIIL